MSLFSRLAELWSSCFRSAKAPAERSIEQAVRKRRPRQILEIGMGNGQRARRAITLAQRYHGKGGVQYVGIDLFEDRHADQAPLALKDAYRQLRVTGARIRLVPGDAYGGLVRAANSLAQVELVLIAPEVAKASLAAAWFYLPRTLAKDAVVLWADGTLAEGEYREVSASEVLAAARPARTLRRRAA